MLCCLVWRGASPTQNPGKGCPAPPPILAAELRLALLKLCLLALVVPCGEERGQFPHGVSWVPEPVKRATDGPVPHILHCPDHLPHPAVYLELTPLLQLSGDTVGTVIWPRSSRPGSEKISMVKVKQFFI